MSMIYKMFPIRRNYQPSTESPTDIVNTKVQTATYYRKRLDCNCNGMNTEIIKNVSCCKSDKDKIIRTGIINNKTVKDGYNVDTNQYLSRRCLQFDQRNTKTPSCCNTNCRLNNVYKRSNATFNTNGAVSSSARLMQRKYNTLQKDRYYNRY